MARNSPGDGSIIQRPDGRWQGSLQVEGRRSFVYSKTKSGVKAKVQALQREARGGVPSNPGRKTLCDLLDLWLTTAAPTLKPRTLHDYGALADRYIRPALGQVRLSRLTPARLQGFYRDLVGLGLKRAPSQVHRVLHRALGMAVLWGLLPFNPADRVMPPGYRAERREVWTSEDLLTLITSTDRDRHGPLWAFLAGTGCRIGEALGLKWEAVDLEAGTVTIRRNIQRIGREWVVSRPKTRAGTRTLALPSTTVTALLRQRDDITQWRGKAGLKWMELDLVFPGLTGRPLCTSTVHRALQTACRRFGLPPIGPHQLRHAHASLLLAEGVPVTAVSARLGHANPSITMGVYAHSTRLQDRQVANVLEKAQVATPRVAIAPPEGGAQ